MVCTKYLYLEIELGIDDKRTNLVDTGSELSWVDNNQPALIALSVAAVIIESKKQGIRCCIFLNVRTLQPEI